MAAETVVHLLFRAYGEGRRFFLVKWAQTEEILPSFFEADMRRDNIDDIGRRADFIDFVVRNSHTGRNVEKETSKKKPLHAWHEGAFSDF
jgi:hypothetical protein